MVQVGITERGDAYFDYNWHNWVYEEKKPAILITKSPARFIKDFPGLFIKDENGNLEGNVILHATITGLGGTTFEPNVPPYQESLEGIKEYLNNKNFCKERIVIRQDPLFPTFVYTDKRINKYAYKPANIWNFAFENGLRYRTSFFDYYPHVRLRFAELPYTGRSQPQASIKKDDVVEYIKDLNDLQQDFHLSLDLRENFYNIIKTQADKYGADIEICGEPGMPCTGCLSKRDLDIFGIELDTDPNTGYQRPACACLGIKKELLNGKHPCKHGCIYCFWKDGD